MPAPHARRRLGSGHLADDRTSARRRRTLLERYDSYPAFELADLILSIAQCSTHPCLGDAEGGVREFLLGRILEGDCDEFSDLRVAYPGAAAPLKGIAGWSLDEELDDIYLILTGFPAPGSIVMSEIVRARADCEIEEEDEEGAPSLLVFECDLDDEDGTTLMPHSPPASCRSISTDGGSSPQAARGVLSRISIRMRAMAKAAQPIAPFQ